jgi:predicted ATPase
MVDKSTKDHEIDPQAATVPVAALFELRAEVERLRRQIDACQGYAYFKAWEESQAEVERLSDANASLRVSNDNLRSLLAQSAHGEIERLRAAMSAVLKAHAEWERACELDSDRADDAWYGLHDAIEHDLAPLL